MSLITDLKSAFTHGAQDTLNAAQRDWKSLKRTVDVVTTTGSEVVQGTIEAVEGLVAFPTVVTQYLTGTTEHFGELTSWSDFGKHFQFTMQDNPFSRVATVGNHLVLGGADLLTGHLLYSAATALGIQDYTPWFTPTPTDARGIARDLATAAMIFAIPAAKAKGYAALGIPEKTVPVAETPLARQLAAAVQQRAEAALQKVLAADDAAFARAWDNTATAGARGAIEIPQWMLSASGKADYLKLFRQADVTNADLAALTQHTTATVSAAAKQVLAERSNPIPEGYMPIPSGEFEGQTLSPFAAKATPVTNGEWFQGVDGKPRFVMMVKDPQTLAMRVEDVITRPPSSISPLIIFDAGEVAVEGSKILVKLVDNPSAVYDASGRAFSQANQPVVGVNLYHAKAWTLTDASGRLSLPTDLMQEAVASDFGKQKFGTATGKLYGADGRKLGHFDEWNKGGGHTADVNDPRYPAGPFGVQSTGNVRRWMQADPSQSYPYGLRGGSWNNFLPEVLRAAFRDYINPAYRRNYVGFQPVVLPGLK